MTEAESQQQPFCRFSSLCRRYLDEIGFPFASGLSDSSSFNDSSADEQLTVLREHVPTCPTCQQALEQEWKLRAEQRTALRGLLVANEQEVPSTTVSILAAIRQEARSQQHPVQAETNGNHRNGSGEIRAFDGDRPRQRTTSSRHKTRVWQRVIAVALVASVLLASVGLFSRMVVFRSQPASSNRSFTYTDTWNSTVIGLPQNGHVMIDNYEPFSGKHSSLMPDLPAYTTIDDISRDGHTILYHVADAGNVSYSTLERTDAFYTEHGAGSGSAVWLSDNLHVLIATMKHGIVQVDSQTGDVRPVSTTINNAHLLFYRDGYVYLQLTEGSMNPRDLFRINIVSGALQRVTRTQQGGSYLLSPDGTTIFYVDVQPGGVESSTALYTTIVNGEGSAGKLFLNQTFIPVGFAADTSLMVVQKVGSGFQLVKLKPLLPVIDRVVMKDIAPQAISLCNIRTMTATSICNENIALSPYGRGLIVTAAYSDGSYKVWADDLTSGKQHVLLQLKQENMPVQLPGWDRIQVPETSSTVTAAP